MKIEIGNRKLIDITQDELMGLCMIEKVHAHADYWNPPIITDYDKKMFSDTIVMDYHSFRIEDGLKSDTLVFFFNHKEFTFHYHRKNREHDKGNNRLNLESIKYLISLGFDLPIY